MLREIWRRLMSYGPGRGLEVVAEPAPLPLPASVTESVHAAQNAERVESAALDALWAEADLDLAYAWWRQRHPESTLTRAEFWAQAQPREYQLRGPG